MTVRANTLRLGLVAAATVVGLLATGGPALADDPTLPGLKTALTHRIDLRLAALAKDTTVVNGAKNLTAADKSTLTSLIGQDTTGLTALRTKVAGQTTVDALKADATSMVDDYRIFLLVGPKVRLAVAGDAETVAGDRLQDAHDRLATQVAAAKAAGHDTSAAEAELSDMQAAIDRAGKDGDGQVATLLAIQAGPDGTAITAKVTGVRQALSSARTDLRTALADGKKVAAFLKSLPSS